MDTRLEKAEARTDQAETRAEQAKTRAESAETRTEQAENRTELAKTRTEQAETRTGQAETRAEQAESRAEQAETTLESCVHNEMVPPREIPPNPLTSSAVNGTADRGRLLERLTARQREILQLIAQGENTKQIADILQISPKTVEYHRMKLMTGLNVHDIPGLVRLAMRVGLIPPEG
jgi:DNA-binding CsgD family transcriptional regulator